MRTHSVWMLDDNIDIAYEFGELLIRDKSLGVQNTSELRNAQHMLAVRLGGSDQSLPLPGNFPVPQLGLPAEGFAPDYLSFGNYHFCSRKFRDAMAQPETVVEYRPVELTSGGPDAIARNYRWLRVLARQSAVDMWLSDCEVKQITNVISGRTITVAWNIEQPVLLANFAPDTEIFHVAETLERKMVTDALAVRVLRAGCTGMEFRHPEDKHSGMRIAHFRTIDGVGERRIGFLD